MDAELFSPNKIIRIDEQTHTYGQIHMGLTVYITNQVKKGYDNAPLISDLLISSILG